MNIRSPSIRCHHAKIKLQSVRHTGDPFRTTRVLADHNSFLPFRDVVADPSRYKGLCVEVVDRLTEETLSWWCLEP